MQICCSTHSVILNVTPHSSLSSVYSPTDWYTEVVIVHTCALQSPLIGCQVIQTSPYVNNGWTFFGQTSYFSEFFNLVFM